MPRATPKPPVIVLNSHVAHGSVGGRAAVFALQRLGFPVISVPTVILPWHPGHGPGTRIPLPDFSAVLADLARAPWLSDVAAILTGYIGNADQAEAIASLVQAAKRANPSLRYLLDPVLGDEGRLYMSAAVLDVIRDRLLPLADIVTPNRSELGFLTGRPVDDNAALIAAARALGTGEVLVTSAYAARDRAATLLVTEEGAAVASHPRVAQAPHGTGDLLAALYLAHRLDGASPQEALALAASATLGMIEAAAGGDELPLAEAQAALLGAATVTVETIRG